MQYQLVRATLCLSILQVCNLYQVSSPLQAILSNKFQDIPLVIPHKSLKVTHHKPYQATPLKHPQATLNLVILLSPVTLLNLAILRWP